VKPGFGQHGPVGDRKIGRAEAVAVASLGKDVKLGRNLCLLQCLEVDQRVLFVDGVVFGLKQEGRRRVRGGVDAMGELVKGWSVREVAGVDDEGEVGAGAGLVRGLAGTLEVGVVAEDHSEMRAGGEAEDADAVGIDVPLGGVGAGDAHGLLRVFEVSRVLGIVIGEGNAILDQHAGHADGVEPRADLGAFEVIGEDAIASAGEDEDGCAGVRRGGRVDGERRFADVGEMHQLLSSYERVGGLGDVGLGLVDLRGLRCAVGPEGKGYFLREGEGRGDDESEREDEGCTHENMVMPLWDKQRQKQPQVLRLGCAFAQDDNLFGVKAADCHP
jgi:hypothetical protein